MKQETWDKINNKNYELTNEELIEIKNYSTLLKNEIELALKYKNFKSVKIITDKFTKIIKYLKNAKKYSRRKEKQK